MTHRFESVALGLIDVPADRLRQANADRVEVLAVDIAANGLLQPIGLVEEPGGRYTLSYGLHRLEAVRSLGLPAIEARVTGRADLRPDEPRLQEIMENLDREGLTAFARAENLAELKRVHEALFPQTRNGAQGGRGGKRNESEIFSFSIGAAERTGLSRRAIEIAVAIVGKLSETSKARLRGTWLEDHQAGLKALSEQPHATQERVCDLLFSTPPAAANVAEALVLAAGQRLPTARDKLFRSTSENLARMKAADRGAIYDAWEAEIREHAARKGWFA